MKRDIAERANILLIRHSAEVNALLLLIKNKGQCGDEEFKAYRRAVGNVMGSHYDIMQALYHEHPDLKPEWLGGPYKTKHLRFELAEQLHDLAEE